MCGSSIYEVRRSWMFPVIEVPDDAPNFPEQLGTKEKFWYEDEGKTPFLFKFGRHKTGDDWSEKVACELCGLLGIPHAHYELAAFKNRRGVVTENFVSEERLLVHGNELLGRIIRNYPINRFRRVREHTLNRVLAILKIEIVKAPIGGESFSGVASAWDFFVGYLMLDAWIANQDRHHANWGFVVSSSTVHLAPSYDHASCLGSNEIDKNREDRLTTRDRGRSMEKYVGKASSAFYASPTGKKSLSTLDAFRKASEKRPEAAKAWIRRLGQISTEEVGSIFEKIPDGRISDMASAFAQRILKLNRERLLEVQEEL